MHILLVEDQTLLAENIKEYLELEKYAVTVAHDGDEGLACAMTRDIDLVILDVNLPGTDGYAVCAELRARGKNMPVLMLTARAKRAEVIRGLDTGADDYLTKPFDLEELLARVRALLRRGSAERAPRLSAGDIEIDTNTQEVFKKGRKIDLSPKEYGLLEFLTRNRGVAQDRATIIQHVWGGRDELLFSQTVDVHVAYLRKKLGKNAIRTVPRKGYLLPSE